MSTSPLDGFTAEQISAATRGLSVAGYVRCYNAGARGDSDIDLGDRVHRYMSRGVKTAGHEQAYLVGNSYVDDPVLVYLETVVESSMTLTDRAQRSHDRDHAKDAETGAVQGRNRP